MKKAVIFAMLTALLLTGVASGQAISSLPGSGWWTSAGIQNVGVKEANVVLTAYSQNPADTTTYAATTTIAKDGSVTFLPGGGGLPGVVDVSPGLPDGFAGSMVISSDEPLVAIGQVGNNQLANPPLGTAGGYASGMYRGASEGANTISFPTAKSNFGGKTSTFFVQAAGSDVNATATVRTNDGVSHTATYNPIKANKSVVVNMADFSPAIATTNCGAPNTSPCLGAITVVGNNPIVGVAIETDTGASPATRAQVASMFKSTDAAGTIYCPVFKNTWSNRYTGVTVQNVSGSTQTFNATFTVAGASNPALVGNSYTASITGVPDGASQTFSAQIPNVGGFPANAYGSVVVTAGGPIIAAVNEANFNAAPLKATTYTCFSASSATSKVAFPQVKENFGVNTTGVSVQNIGAAGTTINATYTCAGVSYTHVGVSLAKDATYTYYKPSGSAANWSGTALPNNKLCAVVVTAGQPIVGIGQEAATNSLDTKNYEAFNLTP